MSQINSEMAARSLHTVEFPRSFFRQTRVTIGLKFSNAMAQFAEDLTMR